LGGKKRTALRGEPGREIDYRESGTAFPMRIKEGNIKRRREHFVGKNTGVNPRKGMGFSDTQASAE